MPDIIDGNLEDLHNIVDHAARQMVEQVMKNFYEFLGDVTEQTGNVVTAGDDIFESFVQAIENVDMTFDADTGKPNMTVVLHPSMYERVQSHLENATDEQRQRLDDIIRRKRESYYASRRRRRLS